MAEVIVNGKNTGVLWMAPFEVDITNYLHKGNNQIEVKITNQWFNRLIGDENYPRHDDYWPPKAVSPAKDIKMPDWNVNNQPMPKGARTTFSVFSFSKNGNELIPSGIKGQ